MQDTLQSIAQSDAASSVASIAGKMTIAGGAGTAAYGVANSEFVIAIIGALFTAATFFVNWYYERRGKDIEKQRADMEASIQQQRLELARLALERAEARKAAESQARIAAMQRTGAPIFAPDTNIGALSGEVCEPDTTICNALDIIRGGGYEQQ